MKLNFNSLGGYLLKGIFILAPVYLTGYAIFQIFQLIDSPVQNIFYSIFQKRIYGIGLLSIVILLIFVGYLGSTILMNRVFKWMERLIFKIPLVKEIYKTLRDIIGAFASDKKKFDIPVLVNMAEGISRIGFITNENLTEFDIAENYVSVYFPFSYALTGELLVIEKSHLTLLDPKDVKDLMKFVISGGIVNQDA